LKTVRVLKTLTGKAHPPWGIFDSDNNDFLGSFPSKTEALRFVEEEGYILKSDMPEVLGADAVAKKYQKKLKHAAWIDNYSYE
jgi:hypothetical protein